MCGAHQLLEVGERVFTKSEKQKVHLLDDSLGEIKEYLCHFIATMAFLGLLLQIHFITQAGCHVTPDGKN